MADLTAASVAEKALPTIEKVALKLATDLTNVVNDKLRVKLHYGFKNYVEQTVQRYSAVRTILGTASPVTIDQVYVNLELGGFDGPVRDDEFLTERFNGRKVIITATAGSGKSMLMRYLFFMYLQQNNGKLGIFVELRDLNVDRNLSIKELVLRKIRFYIKEFNTEQLQYAMDDGLICVFLDGFDEIDFDIRPQREAELLDLEESNKNLTLFISSRPEQSFNKWEAFDRYSLSALSQEKLRMLIEKIPYDIEAKQRFLARLKNGLYEKHREFLVNPLLAIMMLLTIDYIPDVPGKVHLFYEYAFEALFKRHDATKTGNFQRRRYSNLPMDDYRRLLAYFCAQTYMRSVFSFPEVSALGYIQQSINASQIDEHKVKFLQDLAECTCLVVRDGLDYTFSHRSFQEYFTAFFLSNVKADNFSKLAPKMIGRARFDNVFPMISEMNKEMFETWSLPMLKDMLAEMAGIDPRINPVGFADKIYGGITLTVDGDHCSFTVTKDSEKLGVRNMLYTCFNLFQNINQLALGVSKPRSESQLLDRIKSGEILSEDERFDAIRLRSTPSLKLVINVEDNSWIATTDLGKFMAHEPSALTALVEELSNRIKSRNDGLASMFDEDAKIT